MVRGSTTSTWSSCGQFRLAERGRHRHVAIEREFRGLGVERLAVVEFDAGPQLDEDLLAVGGGLVRQRQLRHDVELFVDVEQLVAERREHDAAHISARQRRIENVRILGKPDAQRGLGLNGRLERQQQGRRGHCQTQYLHRTHPHIHGYTLAACVPTIPTPARRRTFRPPEGGDQFFQQRRKAAIGGNDVVRRRQFRNAVAGGGVSGGIGVKLRHLAAAAIDRIGAAGVKAAAGGRIERARHLALQHDAAALCLRLRHRNGRQQRAAIGMAGGGKQRLGFRGLDDDAEIHHGDAVGDVLHDGQIVRRRRCRRGRAGPAGRATD